MLNKQLAKQLCFSDNLILTPNQRLAAYLSKLQQKLQITHGQRCWQPAKILPLMTFLKNLSLELMAKQELAPKLILNSQQCQYLWQKILQQGLDPDLPTQVPKLAELTYKAYALCHQWQIDWNDQTFAFAKETKFFSQLAIAYENYCDNHDYLDENRIIAQLLGLTDNPYDFDRIYLYGFLETYPLLDNLLQQFKQFSIKITVHQAETRATNIKRVTGKNEKATYAKLADYCHASYRKTPNKTIGIIVPNLSQARIDIDKAFSKAFYANEYINLKRNYTRAFNLSSGQALWDYALIYTAFLLFELDAKSMDINQVSYLLRSSVLFSTEQLDLTLQADTALKNKQQKVIYKNELLTMLYEFCPEVGEQFSGLFDLKQKYLQQKLAMSQWLVYFQQILAIFAWPGHRTLDSHDYQLAQSFLTLLQACYSLDILEEKFSLKQSLTFIKLKLQQSLFQPQSHNEPIQILGVLEGIGIEFDELWLLNLTATTLPAIAKPNPFLPYQLQKQIGLPSSSPTRELVYAQTLLNTYFHQANTIFLHHQQVDNDDQPIAPSPLITQIATTNLLENCNQADPCALKIHQVSQLEKYVSENQVALTTEERAKITGGSDILKQMALCPFRSFAYHRLKIKSALQPLSEISPLTLGNILHRVLELFWRQVQTQKNLLQMSHETVQAQLKKLITQCFLQNYSQEFHANHQNLIHLNIEKLLITLLDYVNLEKQRPEFSVIATEKKLLLNLAGLALKLRIDRIDELEDNAYLLIDYKTTSPSINSLFSTRPEEPQLLLYAVNQKVYIDAVSFLQIQPQENKFNGLAEGDSNIKGIARLDKVRNADANEWHVQLQHWQDNLTELAQQFIHGECQLDPKNLANTCGKCELQSLCRVNDE